MTRARDIRPGQSIRIPAGTVTVTKSELGKQDERDSRWSISDGKWSIHWASGSRSGMHRCPPKADVQAVYTPKPRWTL